VLVLIEGWMANRATELTRSAAIKSLKAMLKLNCE
jgi:hypothetical protein